MSIFQKRLQNVMAEKGVRAAQIARDLKISTATLSKYLSNPKKEPSLEIMIKLSSYFDVSPEWLYGATDVRKPFKEPKLVEIYEKLSDIGKKEVYDFACYLHEKEQTKEEQCATNECLVLGRTAAGAGCLYEENREYVTVENVPKGADFALRIIGDSMEPKIKDGSIVFVRKQETVENGEIAVVDIGGETVCKKVHYEDGQLELRSLNEKYTPIHPSQARIIGKVIL